VYSLVNLHILQDKRRAERKEADSSQQRAEGTFLACQIKSILSSGECDHFIALPLLATAAVPLADILW
jgi:hypothetical protein